MHAHRQAYARPKSSLTVAQHGEVAGSVLTTRYCPAGSLDSVEFRFANGIVAMTHKHNAVTLLLKRLSEGDGTAEHELLEIVYDELRRIAASKVAALAPGDTLQATALVNEAYMKLASGDSAWDGRAHFFGAAARAMRNIIVDQIRRKATVKHGAEWRQTPLDARIAAPTASDPQRVLEIEEALARLEIEEPRAATIVDMRFFVGLSDEDTAQMLGISARTVHREWTYAKAWLRKELADTGADDMTAADHE